MTRMCNVAMQQQCVDSLFLHGQITRTHLRMPKPLMSSSAAADFQRGSLAVRQATKPRGSTYYERYLRNRMEKGGEFIGPPKGPLLLQQASQQQQPQPQQQSSAITEQAQQQEQEQTQQQQNPQHDPMRSPALAAAGQPPLKQPYEQYSALTPLGFKQLLDQCLLATAPSAVGSMQVQNPSKPQNPPSDGSGLDQAQLVAGAAAAAHQQQQQQQWLRQPWTFRDSVTPGKDASEPQRARLKKGLTVEPPVVTSRPPLMPLPRLSSKHSSSSSSSSMRRRVLHVFWDISSIHPGGYDPRVILTHLKRICSAYGIIYGIYAYGIKKQFSWVPEAFMLQYAPARLPGLSKQRRQQQLVPNQQQQQQQQLEGKLASLAAAGVDLDEQLGPLRCPACGKLRSNYAQLHLHMVQRHKQPPPPLFKLLPVGALDALATQTGSQTAAAAALGGEGSSSWQQQVDGWLNVGSVAGSSQDELQKHSSSSSSKGVQSLWAKFDAKTMQNSSTRTLGRVNRYYNSEGALFKPPLGHQISLKYVLLREGVDIRLVQNQKRAVDVSLAAGLTQLLQNLLQRDADWTQAYEDTVVVVSDRGTHSRVLGQLQKSGFRVVAVCRRIRELKGADITLRWQWVVDGRYDTGQADGDALHQR